LLCLLDEQVRDLFNPSKLSARDRSLKVRDHPQTGSYVEGLSRVVLQSFAEFSQLLSQGNAVRSVASTQMNATSSRAHTVFQIVLTASTFDVETQKSSSKTSRINLVDLAGSERLAKVTGAAGTAHARERERDGERGAVELVWLLGRS